VEELFKNLILIIKNNQKILRKRGRGREVGNSREISKIQHFNSEIFCYVFCFRRINQFFQVVFLRKEIKMFIQSCSLLLELSLANRFCYFYRSFSISFIILYVCDCVNYLAHLDSMLVSHPKQNQIILLFLRFQILFKIIE